MTQLLSTVKSFINISGGTLPPSPDHHNTPNVGGNKLPLIMHLS